MDSISLSLKDARTRKGITQQQVAEELKIDKSTYEHYEAGRRVPNAETWIQLAKILDIPMVPAQVFVTYPDGLLNRLNAAILEYGTRTGDYKSDLKNYDNLSSVLNEVIDVRSKALSIDALRLNLACDISSLSGSLTLLNALLDIRGEELINKAMASLRGLLP